MISNSAQVKAYMKIAMEEPIDVPKSIHFDTPEKQLKKCSKKWCFDF